MIRYGIVVWALIAGCGSEYGVSAPLEQPRTDSTDGRGPFHEDVFGRRHGPLDVLFVVDDSRSMSDVQEALATNFSTFLDAFLDEPDRDFHVGVISTDVDDPEVRGRLHPAFGRRWADPDTPRPAEVVAEMVRVGIDGSNEERGRDAVLAAVSEEGEAFNAGFFRPEASLHVVVVSDEDDDSDAIGREAFAVWLVGLRPPPLSVTFSSVVGLGDEMWLPTGCRAERGLEYLEVTAAVGGIAWSVCDDSWGARLADLGAAVAGPGTEFFLTRHAVPETIEVTVEVAGEPIRFEGGDRGWLHDRRRNAVMLVNYVPPAASRVRVRYQIAQ